MPDEITAAEYFEVAVERDELRRDVARMARTIVELMEVHQARDLHERCQPGWEGEEDDASDS